MQGLGEAWFDMARILLVDDDARFRKTLHLALHAHGYEVGEAADGKQGLHSAAAEQPDLILLDWHMPEMNGIEACRALRTTFKAPIILISANRSNSKQTALEAGATDYLPKPFSLEDLLTRIEAALESRA